MAPAVTVLVVVPAPLRVTLKITAAPPAGEPPALVTVAVKVTEERALTVVGDTASEAEMGSTTVTVALAAALFSASLAVALTDVFPKAALAGTVFVNVAVPVAPTAIVSEFALRELVQPEGSSDARLNVRDAHGEASLLRTDSVKFCAAPRSRDTDDGDSVAVGATLLQVLAITVMLLPAVVEWLASLAMALIA